MVGRGTHASERTTTVVRVLPDVPAIDRAFDYVVPPSMAPLEVGTMVRVPLHGRRVAGWVLEVDVEPPDGITPVAVTRRSGIGPDPSMIDLCRWAAWRWSGRMATFLRAASPPTMLSGLPRRPDRRRSPGAVARPEVADALARPRAVLRLPPTEDPLPTVLAVAARGDVLVVCPEQAVVSDLSARLRRAGVPVAVAPREWAAAAAGGCVVIGTRAAAFAPMPDPAAFVVIDEQAEALQNEQSPTWHARDVLLERARRARRPALMTSPCPSLESVARSPLLTLSRADERRGWPLVEVIDRRHDDTGRTGLFSERLVRILRDGGRVVAVLNRTGRARLLACRACGTMAQCERCEAAVVQPTEGVLHCPRCGTERPVVCAACGSTDLRRLRLGVGRAAEELSALLREPVAELTGASAGRAEPTERVVVGTEAALHRIRRAAVVAFLDIDQELLARRYRAAEEAMTLLARAARVVGARDGGGRIVAQTRVPDHESLRAAVAADPGIVMEVESERRRRLGFPPAVTLALVGGPAAPAFVERFGRPAGVEVRAVEDEWMLMAEERATLLDALAATPRPGGRLRLQVDPMRLP